MRLQKHLCIILALALALSLFSGCAAKPTEPEKPTDNVGRRVASVEEFLAAVGPGVTIELAEGEFTLPSPQKAGDVTQYCRWVETYDGYELEIHDVPDLTVRGAGADKTVLSALPRYANVLTFRNCENLTVADLTAGHTQAPGFCSGGVLRLTECRNAAVTGCGLFGCGTVGVQAENCAGLSVKDTKIYECSWNAVSAVDCSDIFISGCEVYDCGKKDDGPAYSLFQINDTDGFCVVGTLVRDNAAQYLLTSYGSRNVKFLSGDVHGNRFDYAVFDLSRGNAAVDGCALADNSFPCWTGAIRPVDAAGSVLTDDALAAMTLRDVDPESVAASAPASAPAEVPAGGEIRVTTVDELLAAIGPDRTVLLAPGSTTCPRRPTTAVTAGRTTPGKSPMTVPPW